jgi:hypothetical protein
MIKPSDYTEEGKHLPEFLKDFHDQKDVFKTIHNLYHKDDNPVPNNFRDNMIFTIDYFLWFMGQHGYKLQKDRTKNVEFHDIQQTIDKYNGYRVSMLSKIISDQPSNSTE